ncbi:MAG: repressor LexA [Elusimicrobia bacterium]|nr:repressor LexA [Elusimicrobiota bacterium]
MTNLTQKQKKVLDFISHFIHKSGQSPTYREIQAHFRYASLRAVVRHIEALVKKGFLEKGRRQFRSLMPTSGIVKPEWSGLIPLPEVMAAVPAGNPRAILDEIEEVHWISKSITGPGEFFFFRVEGESMINVGILSGDSVIARKQAAADVGDIVVAAHQGAVTLKRYGRDSKGNHLLIPENDQLETRVIDSGDPDFLIAGKMMFLIRKTQNLKQIQQIAKLLV